MARTPEQLRNRLSPRDKRRVDALEADIDATMDETYQNGEPFRFPVHGISFAVLSELKRRYDRWNLSWNVTNLTKSFENASLVLKFEPKENVA